MYSKAGKATSEIFSVLQHTEDILDPRNMKLKATYSPKVLVPKDKLSELAAQAFGQKNLLKDLASVLDSDEAPNKNQALSKSVSSVKEFKKFEPFAQVISRDKREKVLGLKTVSSNAAYYQPKFEHIEKKTLGMVDYSKSSSKRMFDDIIANTKDISSSPHIQQALPLISDKPRSKVKGAVLLSCQISRPDVLEEAQRKKICVTDALPNPDLPNSLSSVPHLPRIRFSRSLPRKDMSIETAADNCPIYDVNHEFVKKSLGHVGAAIDKVTGRKEQVHRPYYTFGEVYNYDEYVKKNKSHIYPKIHYPDLNKMPPREKDPNSKYPAYLQPSYSKLNDSVQTVHHKHSRSMDTSMFSIGVNLKT